MDMIYTVNEVAKLLKVGKNKVYELIKYGHLKALKFGSIKVTHKELEKFLENYTGKDLDDMENVKEFDLKSCTERVRNI